MATVVIACIDDHAQLEAGVFLVDMLCLGVKDAFVAEMPATDWPQQLDRIIDPTVRQPLHPSCARKLVEGAVAYAESLGFDPCRDYKKARRVFGSVSARDCPESFSYGQDGKPHYVAGPDDDQTRIDRIVRTLTAKLGADGFYYTVPVSLDSDDDEPGEFEAYLEDEESGEIAGDTLRKLFATWGRPSDFHVLSGMITAACVCPGDIDFEELEAALWEGRPPAAWDERRDENFIELLTEFWNETVDRLDHAEEERTSAIVPHYVDEAFKDSDELRAHASAWCRGFMRAVTSFPDAWGNASENFRVRFYFEIMDKIARTGRATILLIPLPAQNLSVEIGRAVLELRSILSVREDDKSG